MKEMTYTNNRNFSILYAGTHRDLRFWVISYGTHPCVYVDATKFKNKLGDDPIYSAPIYPHGGITYDDDNLQNVWDEAFEGFEHGKYRIIGWDYAHLGDYDMLGIIGSGKKWTTSELISDARQVIDDLFELEKQDGVDRNCSEGKDKTDRAVRDWLVNKGKNALAKEISESIITTKGGNGRAPACIRGERQAVSGAGF